MLTFPLIKHKHPPSPYSQDRAGFFFFFHKEHPRGSKEPGLQSVCLRIRAGHYICYCYFNPHLKTPLALRDTGKGWEAGILSTDLRSSANEYFLNCLRWGGVGGVWKSNFFFFFFFVVSQG